MRGWMKMKSIYVLSVINTDEDYGFDMYYSSLENAQTFISNNFNYDNPRKIDETLFEGKNNKYVIEEMPFNQMTL